VLAVGATFLVVVIMSTDDVNRRDTRRVDQSQRGRGATCVWHPRPCHVIDDSCQDTQDLQQD